jgi:ribose transport system substrate-binding protein
MPRRLGAAVVVVTAAASIGVGVAAAAAPAPSLPNLAYARARVARYRAEPRWTAPGPAIAARQAAGKRVAVVPLATALPYQLLLGGGLRAAAAAVGIVLEEQPAEGQPAQWAQGVERAIAQQADLIALVGAPDPLALQPQLRRARKAGIPVVVGNLANEGAPAFPNVTARMDVVAQSAQRIAVDYEIAYTGGTAKTLIVTSNDAGASQGLVAAAQDEYATVCGPGCQVTVVNVPLAQWSTRLQPAVEAALAADRSITIVHPVYDGMTAFAVAGIGTVDGSDFVLRMIQQRAVDGLVLFDVGYSLDWQGWADLDVILRVLLGQPVPRTQNLPRRIFDATNVTAAGTPPSPLKGYGDAYRKGYLQLWGVAG